MDRNVKKVKRRLDLLICFCLVIASLSVYWQVYDHDFINYDDNAYITENRHVQAGLSREGVIWAFTTFHAGNWHPLTWLSHMLDSELFGMKAGLHHLTSLLFHTLNSILLFLLFTRMTGELWKSAFVAALFALHPLHVESVAWVAERKDVLSAFFWFLTIWAYVRYTEQVGLKRYLQVLIFFALGLMSKPMLVTLPFALVLMDYWPLGRVQLWQWRDSGKLAPNKVTILQVILEKAPLLALSAVFSFVAFIAQGRAVATLHSLWASDRIANALISYVTYIGQMFWPYDLAVYYPHPGIVPGSQAIGAGFLLICLTGLFIMSYRSHPYLTVGWFWYLGTLIPVIGLIQVGSQAMADRYTYLPLIGLFIIIAWGIPSLFEKWRYRKAVFGIAISVMLLVMMLTTWRQVGLWKDSETLFSHAIKVTDNNDVAHYNLATALIERGRLNEAIKHCSESLRINPINELPHNNMGKALALQGKIDEAISHFSKALKINFEYADAHNNMGNALASKGQIKLAILHFSKALSLQPDFSDAHNNLGIALAMEGNLDAAIANFREALRSKPDDYRVRENLKRALKQRQGADRH